MLRYTRITIFIPIKTKCIPIIDYFLTKIITDFQGFTISRHSPEGPVFIGSWINAIGKIVRDDIAMLIVDALAEQTELNDYLLDLKNEMELRFEEKEIWIVMHDVIRIT